MKNILLVAVAAMGLLLTACSENEITYPVAKESIATFAIATPEFLTRAQGDGKTATILKYAVYNRNDNTLLFKGTESLSNLSAIVEIPFVNGMTYDVLFWAEAESSPYTVNWEEKTVHYTNAEELKSNNEAYDAFYAFVNDIPMIEGDVTKKVVMKRPFAQLNILAKDGAKAAQSDIVINKTQVVVTGCYSGFNLAEHEGLDKGTYTFDAEAINSTPDDDGVQTLAVNYLFPAKEESTVDVEFTYTYEEASAGDKSLTISYNDIPIQQNYRTNVIGNILTSIGQFLIEIDACFEDEYNLWGGFNGIYTDEALAGQTIEITESWLIKDGYIVDPMPENWTAESMYLYTKPYTIDGLKNTITFEPNGYHSVAKNAFAAADSELVTVKNLSFAGEHFGVFGGVYGGVEGRNNYNTLFENVNIIENGIYCYNSAGSIPMSAFSNLGTATLKNCTITGTYWVGAEKDQNVNAQKCYDTFRIYDIFVPDKKLTKLINCRIGSIYVNNHGKLSIEGESNIDTVYATALVKGTITVVGNGARVTLLDVNEYNASYAPTVTIKAGATVETLRLNSIHNTNKITIEDGANITRIIHKGIEYTSIEDFKKSLL